METIIDRIQSEILNDDADRARQSELLLDEYQQADSKQQELIDKIFICLCGYSLDTLINVQA